MKSLFIGLCLSITSALTAFAQEGTPPPLMPVDEKSGLITYSEVVEVSGATAEQLYNRMHNWFNSYFKSPSSVIQKKDAEAKKIDGKHGITMYKTVVEKKQEKKYNAGIVKYSINVAAKEGKYRYKITNIFKHQSPKLPVEKWLDENDANKEANYQYLNQIHEHMNAMIEDLKAAMEKGDSEETDDW